MMGIVKGMADSSKLTTAKARPRLGQSPQARWQRKMQAAGKCRACGEPRPPELKQLCRACQTKASAYMKLYRARKRMEKFGPVPGDDPGTLGP